MVLVDEFEGEQYEIVHRNIGDVFSLWVRVGNGLRAYYRNGSAFEKMKIEVTFYFDNLLIK